MAKRGRKSWVVNLSDAVRGRVAAAVKAGETYESIFTRFELGRFQATPRRFRVWADVIRRDWMERANVERTPDGRTASQVLLDVASQKILLMLDTGDKLDARLINTMIAAVKARQMELDENEESRKAEKHEKWRAEFVSEQEAKLAAVAQQQGLTPEVLGAIKSQVLGL